MLTRSTGTFPAVFLTWRSRPCPVCSCRPSGRSDSPRYSNSRLQAIRFPVCGIYPVACPVRRWSVLDTHHCLGLRHSSEYTNRPVLTDWRLLAFRKIDRANRGSLEPRMGSPLAFVMRASQSKRLGVGSLIRSFNDSRWVGGQGRERHAGLS